jgi:oligopeptide/dipeptide ABC transporter ATP-binding protein
VAIAAALAPEPALVIADEPTTALDVTTQSAFMALVGRLRKSRGLALLFISHDLALAAATCDRTLVMYGGRVVEDRASSALPAGTAHPYTAGLFASRPNLDKRLERLPSVPGAPQPAWEIDTPCVFAPRCRFAREICHTETPRLRTVGNGLVACHLSEDIREELEEIAEVTNA